MKTLFSAALVAALSFSFAGCNTSNAIGKQSVTEDHGESRAYLHSFNLPSHGVALEGYCPVAYFAVNKPVKGKAEYASNHNGVTYYFVNADAKTAFDAEPEKFIPSYGGWCAFGMAIGDKFPVDPTNFKIVDGKLLVFLKNKNVDARELWNKGSKTENLAKAGAHWKKVQG